MSAAAAVVETKTAYQVAQILASDCSRDEKLQQLDELSLWVMRNHPDGWAAKVLQSIQQAEAKVYGERRTA